MVRHEAREFHGHRGHVHIVDGPEGLLEAVGGDSSEGGEWFGGDTAKGVYSKATFGTDQFVGIVEEMLEKIDAGLNVETASYLFDNAVSGFTPDVPSAILGLPESMIQMESTQTDNAPITVWVNTTMSGGCGAKQVARRGAAIAALVLKLQMIRPVTLKVVTGLDGRGGNQFTVCPINSRPFSMAQVSYILCHPGYTRHTYGLLGQWGGSRGGWDGIFKSHGSRAQSPDLHQDTIGFLGGDLGHDIYIPQLLMTDPTSDTPVEWITGVMAKYRRERD